MRQVRDFEKQLSNLDLEVVVIASYVYAEMSIHHAASKSSKLLSVLNRTPTFWRTCYAGMQSSAYVALGRVFDLKSPFNIEALIISMEHDMSVFSGAALADGKRVAGFASPDRLRRYISEAYVPTRNDLKRIRRAVQKRRIIYDRAIMPVRHRYLAHRQAHGSADIRALYALGKTEEMWKLSCFLHSLYQALWQLYHNGRKPDLRIRSRFSPGSMYERPENRSGPHERIVHEVRTLMRILEDTA